MIKLLKIDNLGKEIDNDERYKVVMGAVLEAMPLIEGWNIHQGASDLISSGNKSWYQRKVHSEITEADKGGSTPTELEELIDEARRAKKDQKVFSFRYNPVNCFIMDNLDHPFASRHENQVKYEELEEQLSRCKEVKASAVERLRKGRNR